MRKAYLPQRRFDCSPIAEVPLNLECRDEVVPVLAGLQFLYRDNILRHKVIKLIAADVSDGSRRDVGRPGMDDWQVVVLAAVRLGCNYDYDKLQDQAQNHLGLRGILGIGDWECAEQFTARRIRDTLCLLQPDTIERINQAIVAAGQQLHGEARGSVRADSFVVETNIHYPTESSLIYDGVRKIIPLCIELADELGESGWRQAKHLLKKVKYLTRNISRISASKNANKKHALESLYSDLLDRVQLITDRAKSLQERAVMDGMSLASLANAQQLATWIDLTSQVCDTAHRRVSLGETVPNNEKLFSLFETHTQLYRRGKAGQPNQFGRLFLVFEDAAGFISHYHLMDREVQDADVIVEQMRIAQRKHGGEIEEASFDRGFHSPDNVEQLEEIVDLACVAPKHPGQYAQCMREATIEFRAARKRHSGIESAIGSLQSGNGLKRCRDRSEIGFERYLGLGVLGRNIHVLGKLVIARRNADALACRTFRGAA